MLTRTRGGFIVHRCQNKNPRTRGCQWRHAPEAYAEGLGEFEKSQLSWVLRSEEEGWLSLARSGLVAGATCVRGRADGKVSIERLCLSPYVEKPLNSKVIKSLVPELRSCKCFSCFGIPIFWDSYVSCFGIPMLWTFYVRFPYLCMGMLYSKLYLHVNGQQFNSTIWLQWIFHN